MPQPLLFRVREVAPLLGLSRSKTYELVMGGRLGSVVIDGCRRVPAEEVTRFTDKLKLEAGLMSADDPAQQTPAGSPADQVPA